MKHLKKRKEIKETN